MDPLLGDFIDKRDRSMSDLSIPFEEIESATDNFADENLIAQGSSGNLYRGQLWQSEKMIDIVVVEFKRKGDNFYEEAMLFLLKHESISPILYCADRVKYENIFLIFKVEANGSLSEHLSGSTLTWTQRLGICIGVGKALKHIHYSDFLLPGYYVIHGNINSSEILLDDDWQPKLKGFESAMVAERNTLYVTSKYEGRLQYKDPAYEKTGTLTAKSDVFSFGVVLFEVLFGRKAAAAVAPEVASTPNDGSNYSLKVDLFKGLFRRKASTPKEQQYDQNFAEFARLHWKNKTLDKMIDPDMGKNMDSKSIEIFSNVAYACLTEQREERPNMDQVVRELELSLALQKNHEHSMVIETSSSRHLQGKSFEHLRIPLKGILSATERFHQKYKIASGGFATVYKAELDHFETKKSSGGNNGSYMSKICSTVAIKLINSTTNGFGEKGFIVEIQTLSKCKHQNIVSFLGYCDEGSQKILIYEYVPNGSLDGYLERSYIMSNLTWGRRIQICLDIAHGLDYLHSGLDGNEIIIHRDIKSANILLDDNLRAKIADFGLSRLYTIISKNSTINTVNLAGTELYLDPEYMKTGKLKKASDIYSFGVVLFEILSGKLAYDSIYNTDTEKGLPSIARRLYKEGKSKAIVDLCIKETDGSIFSQSRVADEHSLDTFLNIANQCLMETQDERPTIEEVIKELEKALNFQKNNQDNLQVLLEDINSATQSFNDSSCIGEGKFWNLYKGEVPRGKGSTTIVAKRWNMSGEGQQLFFKELEFVFRNKHKNVADLVGYCTEMEEKIIVYEHNLSNGSTLDKHLKDVSLTWMERLKICIDVGSGLEFLLHGGGPKETVRMHGDIKSGSILLDGDRKAKVSNLEIITLEEQSNLDTSDADSLGVLLIEVLSGKYQSMPLARLAIYRWLRAPENDDVIVFEGIKDQIDPFSLIKFICAAYTCFQGGSVGSLLRELEEALEIQKYIEGGPNVSFSDIKVGSKKCIQKGNYWKLYEAQISDNANGWINVYAKRWHSKSRIAHYLFFTELRVLLKSNDNKHVNACVGYCNDIHKKFIFYEHASNGSLDKHLDDARLTWKKRLNIGIDVAKGWQYLHETDEFSLEYNIKKDAALKSSSILIDGNWKAKIANLEYYPGPYPWVIDKRFGSSKYSGDNQSIADVYALGVVLLQMLCGRLAWPPEGLSCEGGYWSLGPLVTHYKEKGNLDELMFEGIKEQTDPESSIVFQRIAIKCLKPHSLRATVTEVVSQLEKALELQEYVEESPQISLEDIKSATHNFSDERYIGEGRYWKLYEGEFPDANGRYTPALVKRWDSKSIEGRKQFFRELKIHFRFKKNENIVAVEGYCSEKDEKIIVFEHSCNRSLDKYLANTSLSWTKRLNICIDVASVLDIFHNTDPTPMIHGDIRSGSILIDGDWKAKVSNFDTQHRGSVTYVDVYAFGVVLLEILYGRLGWPEGSSYEGSLGPLAQRHYKEKGKLDELVFEGIKEQIAPESLTAYHEIALKCIAEDTDSWQPQMVKQLKNALNLQEYVEESPQISLEDIKSATNNFSDEKCIGEGRYWKLYEGEFYYANANDRYTPSLVKRWDSKSSQGRKQFFRELKIHFRFKKNENIVAVEGYCSEKDEKIIVFEHSCNRSLDKHLDNTSLSWTKRLNICIDVASVLDIFHDTYPTAMIHGDIRSGSILIDGDWKAKVSNFDPTDNKAHISLGYVDPQHRGSVTYVDLYAFGVVLLEILCGRLAWPEGSSCEGSLGPLAQWHYKEKGNLDELVFEGIKEQIAPESLTAYQEIALKCIADDTDYWQPEMVKQLKNALKLQEDYEMWNSKVPKEFKEYIQMSKAPEVYSTEVIKDLYNKFTNGILLQQGKLWFKLGANGERNEMISATMFSYKNRSSRIWQSIPESRFQKVAQMLDISNLKIQIRIKTHFLSPGINCGVYLVFKFCRSRNFRSRREYVNLSYKRGKDNLHAYFATSRDDEWMMIELFRFSNDKKDINFEAILKRFSRCYCGSRVIYVEGIEFRPIDNVNYEQIEKSKDAQQVLKSCSNIEEVQQSTIECQEISRIFGNDDKEGEKMLSVTHQVNRKKHLSLSPMEFLYDSCNMKPFVLNPSSVSRSQDVEFLPQQVFGIKCKIGSQMLSPDTNYMCYLVFKFSEKCNGLHGPVIIRDLLNWKDKKTGIVYFRSPSPWNLHDTDWVPKGRKDGWMEVTVWKFNSKSKLRNACVPMNLKMITYDGTMSGLIVCSLEIRPI